MMHLLLKKQLSFTIDIATPIPLVRGFHPYIIYFLKNGRLGTKLSPRRFKPSSRITLIWRTAKPLDSSLKSRMLMSRHRGAKQPHR